VFRGYLVLAPALAGSVRWWWWWRKEPCIRIPGHFQAISRLLSYSALQITDANSEWQYDPRLLEYLLVRSVLPKILNQTESVSSPFMHSPK
jgi:hypothetical protein